MLRPYQENAIILLRRSISKGNKRIMLMLPTGSGKTHIAAEIIKSALGKGKKVNFVVDRKTLVNQSSKSFWNHGIDHSIVQADNPGYNPFKDVQVCSIQSLMRRKTPDADLVIVDEAHTHYEHMTKMMNVWDGVPFIGLSATPFTRGLGVHYQDLINPVSTAELIEQGFLVNPIVFAPPSIDVKGIKTVAGDYSKKQVAERVDSTVITADIVNTWLDKGEFRKTILFPANVNHSKALVNEFNESGVVSVHVDAHTPDDDREEIFKKFTDDEITILSSVGVLTKGFDETSVSCIILARPTKSLSLYIQMVGRGLRSHEGKHDCIILDHATNVERLGWPDDPLPDYLCDGEKTESKSQEENEEKKDKELKPKKCPSCHFLVEAKIFTCPKCGHIFSRRSDVEVEDGELTELTRNKAAAKRNRTTSKADKQAFYSAALGYAAERAYRSGWAANSYRDRFGVWPNAMDKTPGVITDEFKNYVTAKNIRYAKRSQSQRKPGEIPNNHRYSGSAP